MRRVVLLGASGSIGSQTLDVITQHPDMFCLVAFGVGKNIAKAEEILSRFDVPVFSVQEEADALTLQKKYPSKTVLWGEEGLLTLAKSDSYDVLVNALVGFTGFMPALAAIESNHDLALANKEALVCSGELIQNALSQHPVKLTPIDSEHSAIFQCLQGNQKSQVKRLIITASGGAFRNKTRAELTDVSVADALGHPTWSMGEKITIDSATMMNKGFEVMEAHYLFDIPYEQIDVLLHKESVIHSMVEYVDHSVMAQLGCPDMRLPIQYALTWPNRLPLNEDTLDLAKIGTLHFEAMDFERFPLLKLAYDVGKKGGNLGCVMNGANEVANLAFRKGRIPFLAIEEIIFSCVETADFKELKSVEDVKEADAWSRAYARDYIQRKY